MDRRESPFLTSYVPYTKVTREGSLLARVRIPYIQEKIRPGKHTISEIKGVSIKISDIIRSAGVTQVISVIGRNTGIPATREELIRQINRVNPGNSGKNNDYFSIAELKQVAKMLGLNSNFGKKTIVQMIHANIDEYTGQ